MLGAMLVDHGNPIRLSLPFLEFSLTYLYSLSVLLRPNFFAKSCLIRTIVAPPSQQQSLVGPKVYFIIRLINCFLYHITVDQVDQPVLGAVQQLVLLVGASSQL